MVSPQTGHTWELMPDEVAANVAWGDDGRMLYMTGQTGLYRIRLTTPGLSRDRN